MILAKPKAPMTRSEKADHAGSLTIVGTGIQGVSHMSLGTIAAIRSADIAFYHVFERTAAAYVRSLNANGHDLRQYYGELKPRRITYIQMAEVMLQSVRKGLEVVGVFSGHPGVFVMASRRAISIAREEGFAARLLPAISSIDCLISDLGIDPGVFGFQIAKAGAFLREHLVLSTGSHVALLQVNSVGDTTYSFTGFKNARKLPLVKKLIEVYGDQHEAVYYEASTTFGSPFELSTRKLGDYLRPEIIETMGFGILYLPPAGRTYAEVCSWRRLNLTGMEAYAIADLQDRQQTADPAQTSAVLPEIEPILEALSKPTFRAPGGVSID